MSLLKFDHQICRPPPQRETDEASRALYALVGAPADAELIVTATGIEQAIFAAYVEITRKTGKNHFIAGSLDEAPAILAMSRLHAMGCVSQLAPANAGGQITAQAVAETITPRTAMVSLSWANGLTGVVQPIAEIAKICQERGILFHVDATHVLGKGYFSFETCGADLLTFSGEPLPGPSGTGALFLRKGLALNVQPPPPHLSSLLELAQAAKEALAFRDHYCMEIARLRARFEKRLPGKILFSKQERVPHITSLLFPNVTSDALLYLLQRKGLSATFGGGQFQHLMHLLKACGIEEPECHTALSFALSKETTEEQIEKGAAIIKETVAQLQKHAEKLFV